MRCHRNNLLSSIATIGAKKYRMLSNKNGDIVGNYEGKWIDVDYIDGELLMIMADARRESR